MTAEEKKNIYSFLKLAETSMYGYSTGNFDDTPAFEDDIEEKQETISQTVTTSSNFIIQADEDNQTVSADSLSSTQQSSAVSENVKNNGITLQSVKEKIALCHNCILCQKRTNTVPGEGCEKPLVLVVGEGPGEDEDKTGRPFVGKAGQLLDKMLAAINLDRNYNCYIANIVKCRPPMNRTPMPDEAAACSGYLQAQIHILKPKMILCMGRTAVQNLLNTQEGIKNLRGKFFEYNGIPLLATFHPSALLRDESLKVPAWHDLKTFRTRLLELSPEYEDTYRKAKLSDIQKQAR